MKRFYLALVASAFVVSTAIAQDSTKPKGLARTGSAGGDVMLPKHKEIALAVYNGATGDTMTAIVEDSLSGVSVILPGGVSLNLTSLVERSLFFPIGFIRVRKEGFAPVMFKVSVMRDTANRTVILFPHSLGSDSVHALPEVSINAPRRVGASLQGFEARRSNAGLRGRFITPEELESKWSGYEVETVLAEYGMKSSQRATGSLQAKSCRTIYYVNGVQARGMPEKMANAYSAIEFYPSTLFAPPQFVGPFSANVCGIFVFWLKGS